MSKSFFSHVSNFGGFFGISVWLSFVFLSVVEAAPTERDGNNFAVIVDAGSSGSRIYVYQYDGSEEVPNLEQIKGENGKPWAYKKEPGISTLAGKLEGVEEYVGELLQHLKDELPEASFPRSKWDKTPFMWFATAGMRLLPTKAADDLTNKLRQVAKDKNVVPFLFVDRWCRTLSGEEEGAFAWISLNYLNEYFTKDGVVDYGVVETGGASSQMTFLSRGNILSNKFNVIIDRKQYPLYTHSFLYFGQTEIIKRIFTNECFCRNSKDNNCQSCIDDNGYKGNPVESACLINGYARSDNVTDSDGKEYRVEIIGTGDPDQCALEMDYLFRPDYTCFTKPCSFAGIYQPPFGKDRKFYGTSAVRYAIKDLGLLETSEDVTWPKIRESADAFCRKSLDTLDTDKRYEWMRCLTGIFVAKEIEHLKFAQDHSITIADFDTWTVGAVLYQLELMEILLPGQDTRSGNSASFFTSSTLLTLLPSLYGISLLH